MASPPVRATASPRLNTVCMYGDGCLLLLVDPSHEAAFSHTRYSLTVCKTPDCPIYIRCYQYVVDVSLEPTPSILEDFHHTSSHYHPNINSSRRFNQLSRVGGNRRPNSVSRSGLKITRSTSDGMLRLLAVVPVSEEVSVSVPDSLAAPPPVPKLPLVERTLSGEGRCSPISRSSSGSSTGSSSRSPSRSTSISPGAKQYDGKKSGKTAEDYSPKNGGSLLKKVLGGESEQTMPRGWSKELDRVDTATRANTESIQQLGQQLQAIASNQIQLSQQLAALLEAVGNLQKKSS